MRQEVADWKEIDTLVDHLTTQFNTEFDLVLMLSSGGVIPGGILAEMLGITEQHIAQINIPTEFMMDKQRSVPRLIAWPKVGSFPSAEQLSGKQVLIVGSIWRTGRSILCARSRVSGAGGTPHTCVLHYVPGSNLYTDERPEYYAAVTDAWIIYPWELSRGKDLSLSGVNEDR